MRGISLGRALRVPSERRKSERAIERDRELAEMNAPVDGNDAAPKLDRATQVSSFQRDCPLHDSSIGEDELDRHVGGERFLGGNGREQENHENHGARQPSTTE